MPWKEVTAVNERMEFVARLKAGERMSDLCRELGISRKTGYKFERRYEEHGPSGLYDFSRRPKRLARQISAGIQTAILELKRERPTWGASKIHEVLRRRHPDTDLPAGPPWVSQKALQTATQSCLPDASRRGHQKRESAVVRRL